MGINGIGTAGYPLTGYTARKTEKSTESGTVGFMETVAEKAAQDKATFPRQRKEHRGTEATGVGEGVLPVAFG